MIAADTSIPIPRVPPPGVPEAALAQCSRNHDGQPLLTYLGKRWLFKGQHWTLVPIPQTRWGQA